AAVAQHRICARVVAHDAVECAGVAVRVELEQQLLHPASSLPDGDGSDPEAAPVHRTWSGRRISARPHAGTSSSAPAAKGCLAAALRLSTSSTLGAPCSARAIASFVAL